MLDSVEEVQTQRWPTHPPATHWSSSTTVPAVTAFSAVHVAFASDAGEPEMVTVDMGLPRFKWDEIPLAEPFADGEPICVILGDNIIEKSIKDAVDAFRKQEKGGRILLKHVHDAERFGVAEMQGDKVVGIEEKPRNPKSDCAVIGIYMYDPSVFEKIKTLVPSGRGELEITDVNNAYIREGTMTYSFLDGWWTDAGTFESLHRAANLVAASHGVK